MAHACPSVNPNMMSPRQPEKMFALCQFDRLSDEATDQQIIQVLAWSRLGSCLCVVTLRVNEEGVQNDGEGYYKAGGYTHA